VRGKIQADCIMRKRLEILIKEPLIHFIGAGLALFFLVNTFVPDEAGTENTYAIDIDKTSLIKLFVVD
jgi:hypothetical protein